MHHLVRQFVPTIARQLLPRVARRVVVVGGGPTGLFCADRLRHHFEVTVVDSKEYFEYTPGVLRAVGDAAHLSRITFDYREVLERDLGVEFVHGEATSVDASAEKKGTSRSGHVTVASPRGDESRLSFDYCIVAVGVSNGFWKPRSLSSATGSSSIGGAPSSPMGSGGQEVDERSLKSRRKSLRALRERLSASTGAVVVGAGLVGVELAAELAHFFPRLSVTLVDASPKVCPQLADGAQGYARQWLMHHGVTLKLGEPFSPDSVAQGEEVLWCVGARPRNDLLFADPSVLTQRGLVRVNRRMQVLRRVGGDPGLPAAADTPGAAPSWSGPGTDAGTTGEEYEALSKGCIYAVGDAAAVEGVPMAQMIFHGEEMAAVAVAGIEACENVTSPLALYKGKREAEPEGLPLLCCASLGPMDGMFATQSELLATGTLAALQKQMIEETKVGALKGQLVSSMLWMPVH